MNLKKKYLVLLTYLQLLLLLLLGIKYLMLAIYSKKQIMIQKYQKCKINILLLLIIKSSRVIQLIQK